MDLDLNPFATSHIPLLSKIARLEPSQDPAIQAIVLMNLNDATKLFKLELALDQAASDKSVLEYLQDVRSALRRVKRLMPVEPVPGMWSSPIAQPASDAQREIIPIAPDMTTTEFARSLSQKANANSAGHSKDSAQIEQWVTETNDEPSGALRHYLSHELDEVLAEAKLHDPEILSDSTEANIAFSSGDDLLVFFIHSAKLIERAVDSAVIARIKAGPEKVVRGTAAKEYAFRVLAAFEELFSTTAGQSRVSLNGRGGPASRFVSECFRIVDISNVPSAETLVKWVGERNR